MLLPLGRPGRVRQQVLVAVARDGELTVEGIVTQLLEVRVGLVGLSLAVTVDVDAGERGSRRWCASTNSQIAFSAVFDDENDDAAMRRRDT